MLVPICLAYAVPEPLHRHLGRGVLPLLARIALRVAGGTSGIRLVAVTLSQRRGELRRHKGRYGELRNG